VQNVKECFLDFPQAIVLVAMEDAPSTSRQNYGDIQAQDTARQEKDELLKEKNWKVQPKSS
jgi:hypothetical protein